MNKLEFWGKLVSLVLGTMLVLALWAVIAVVFYALFAWEQTTENFHLLLDVFLVMFAMLAVYTVIRTTMLRWGNEVADEMNKA